MALEIGHERTSGISRMLKKLWVHDMVGEVLRVCKYDFITLGKDIISRGLRLKKLFIIPDLAGS
ncbi:hypothetical protein ACFLTS_03035 [Chloroflexota bacterium]